MTPTKAPRLLAIAALALAACAPAVTPSPTPSPTPLPTASPTLAPTPSPTPATVGVSAVALAYLIPMPGYEYVELPPLVEQQSVAGLQGPLTQQMFRGYAMRSVTKDAAAEAVVMVFEVEPSYLALPGAMDDFVGGMGGSVNAQVDPITLAGQAAFQLTTASTQFVIWQAGTLIVVVVGPELDKVTSASETLLTAHA